MNSQILYEIDHGSLWSLHTRFSHSNATIDDRQCIINLIRNKSNEKLRLSIKFALIRQALKSNLIQRLQSEIQPNKTSINKIKTNFKSLLYAFKYVNYKYLHRMNC